MYETAQVVTVGGRQAIRLPERFHVDTGEVYIAGNESALVIRPKPGMTLAEFFARYAPLPDVEFDVVRDRRPRCDREVFG